MPDIFSGIKQLLLSSKAGSWEHEEPLKSAAVGNCLMFSIINIFLLFLLFRNLSVADWRFSIWDNCFKWVLVWSFFRISVSVLTIQISLPQRHQYFFCDSYTLLWQVYRTLYELILLTMHLCALMVKRVDYWYYISSPGVVVKKAFVEALTTVVLTNDLPNGIKFPMLVLIQEASEGKLFISPNCMCNVNLISYLSLFYWSFQVNQWGCFWVVRFFGNCCSFPHRLRVRSWLCSSW